MAVGAEHVIVTQITSGERKGKSLQLDAVLVFSFRDGKISGCSKSRTTSTVWTSSSHSGPR